LAPVYGYTPIDLKSFGSLCTLLDATNLPIFLSPDCRNVEYLPGLVRSRPGLTSQFSTLTGLLSVNYLKTYINQLIQARMLMLDSLGNLYKENPQGTLSIIGTIENPGAYCNSVSLFSKEYMAFGDELFGTAIPRQYDDTNLDRVSQVGPGAGPTVTDFLPSPATLSNPGTGTPVTISTLTRSGEVDYQVQYESDYPYDGQIITEDITYFTAVDVVTAAPHGLSNGQDVEIAGTSPGGDFDTTSGGPVVVTDATHFTYQQYATYAESGTGGTSTPVLGSVSRSNNILTVHTTSASGFKNGWSVVLAGIPPIATGGTTTASRVSSLVTLTTTTPHGLPAGALIEVDSMSDATFDGQYTIDTVPNSTTLTYSQAIADSTATGGTVSSIVEGTYSILSTPTDTTFTVSDLGNDFQASPASATATIQGNVVAGTHQVSVSFITREGYITRPSPPVSFSAGGGALLSVTNIPIGPINVQYRILMFTPLIAPGGTLGSFYSLVPNMQILDNTTTNAVVDFSDTGLLQGTSQDYLFDLDQLPEASGVTEYNERLVWWGLRNYLQNFDNLTFDGGFGGAVGGFPGTYPLGWTRDPVYGTGGQQGTTGFIFGGAWDMTGDGITAIRGMITQDAYQDEFGDRRLVENTAYSVRVWLRRTPAMVAGNVVVDIYSPSVGGTIGSFVVPVASIGVNYSEFVGSLMPSLATIPQDAVLRLYASGTPTNMQTFIADDMEIFETDAPYLTTDIWLSQVDMPENYSGVDGLISVAPENGQSVRCVFRIRNYLYIAKESSLYVTADTAQGEPGTWTVNEVSPKVGTPSPRGVGLGDEWAMIACQSGLWFFSGQQFTDQNKMSNEIQPTWNQINWQYGQMVSVKVDTVRKRVYVAVPLGSATTPNKMLVMDYVEGFGDPLTSNGTGRKWTIWDIPSNSMDFILRNDGTQPLFIGNGTGTGKIYSLDSSTHNDDGVAINGYWQPGFFQDGTRLNFGYLIANIVGNGICNLMLRSGNQGWLKQLRGWTLNQQGFNSLERQIQQDSPRCSIVFGTNAIDHYFSLQGASMFVQPSAWSPVRGTNNSA